MSFIRGLGSFICGRMDKKRSHAQITTYPMYYDVWEVLRLGA